MTIRLRGAGKSVGFTICFRMLTKISPRAGLCNRHTTIVDRVNAPSFNLQMWKTGPAWGQVAWGMWATCGELCGLLPSENRAEFRPFLLGG